MVGPYNEARGWSGLMLGRLHIWMTDMGLTLTGPDEDTAIPMGREGDCLLIDLVTMGKADKALMAAGCWDNEVYRVSDVLDWEGLVHPAAAGGGAGRLT